MENIKSHTSNDTIVEKGLRGEISSKEELKAFKDALLINKEYYIKKFANDFYFDDGYSFLYQSAIYAYPFVILATIFTVIIPEWRAVMPNFIIASVTSVTISVFFKKFFPTIVGKRRFKKLINTGDESLDEDDSFEDKLELAEEKTDEFGQEVVMEEETKNIDRYLQMLADSIKLVSNTNYNGNRRDLETLLTLYKKYLTIKIENPAFNGAEIISQDSEFLNKLNEIETRANAYAKRLEEVKDEQDMLQELEEHVSDNASTSCKQMHLRY